MRHLDKSGRLAVTRVFRFAVHVTGARKLFVRYPCLIVATERIDAPIKLDDTFC